MDASKGFSRRRFVTAASGVGIGILAGCSESDTKPKSIVKGNVLSIGLGALYRPESKPNDHQLLWILHTLENGEFEVGPQVKEATDLTADDVTPETTIADLPMADIYGELDIVQHFLAVTIHNYTTDEVNRREPLEASDSGYTYIAPSKYFGHIDVDTTYRFRVAEPGDYYPRDYGGRIIDVVEQIEPATETE